MAALLEKQYDLGGLVFGLNSGGVEVDAEGFTPGDSELVTQDSAQPGSDGIRFGKDYRGSATWGFSLFTNAYTETDGWAMHSAFQQAWNARATRLTSGTAIPLRYCIAGQTRRVYGRPRRITPVVNTLSMSGRIPIEADFTVSYPLYFDDDEQVFGPKTIGVPLELDAGIVVPYIPPYISSIGTTTRQSTLNIGGDEDTPLMIKLAAGSAPLYNPIVSVDGKFTVAIEDTIVPGNPVTIDARPWVRSITTQAGGSVKVSPRITRLSKVWLPPGNHEFNFSGEDISSTATVTVYWRNARSSLR